MKYRKKPIVIDAIQYIDEESAIRIVTEFDSICLNYRPQNGLIPSQLRIDTDDDVLFAKKNDWVLRDNFGEFSLCKPDIFEKIYEKVIEVKQE